VAELRATRGRVEFDLNSMRVFAVDP